MIMMKDVILLFKPHNSKVHAYTVHTRMAIPYLRNLGSGLQHSCKSEARRDNGRDHFIFQ